MEISFEVMNNFIFRAIKSEARRKFRQFPVTFFPAPVFNLKCLRKDVERSKCP